MLAYSCQALGFIGGGQKIWFTKGDDTAIARLHALHNRVKHANEAIARGEFGDKSPLCVWLSNDGLVSTKQQFSWAELVDVLTCIAKLAAAAQDPLTMREKLSDWDGSWSHLDSAPQE